MGSFLDDLDLSPELRRSLLALGATSPEALLGLIEAGRRSFEAHFGGQITQQIEEKLRRLAGTSIMQPQTFKATQALGARLEKAPSRPLDPAYDIEERDRLFAEMEALRHTPGRQAEVRELEERLRRLLEQR